MHEIGALNGAQNWCAKWRAYSVDHCAILLVFILCDLIGLGAEQRELSWRGIALNDFIVPFSYVMESIYVFVSKRIYFWLRFIGRGFAREM